MVPEARERGAGGRLLEAVLEEAERTDCRAVDLEVARSQARAERLYGRAGFRRLERSRWVRKSPP